MTNAEMYQQVFGFPPFKNNCPTEHCKDCPAHGNVFVCASNWWDDEYKGSHAVKIDITEHHTFAKPDDVSDIKFGDE